MKTSDSIQFSSGHQMPNRFMLAPMTNQQSHEDGHLSDEEYHWLTMRAKGQFGMVMTCASHVQQVGKGFPGQLGIFSDELIADHQRLSNGIKKEGVLAVIQLHHAGMRSPQKLIGQAPVCPSEDEETGSRALSLEEVKQLRDDFIAAAVRSQKAGYDGVEVHGAHGYILTQFLSAEINKRDDEYGGSLENRSRIIREILEGIRTQCGSDFLLGLRLSPERFGMRIDEIKSICQEYIDNGLLDFLDISLWDSFKMPEDEEFKDKSLLAHFTELDYKNVKWTVAGQIRTAKEVKQILDAGVDFVSIGRAGILHHDFPLKVIADPNFEPIPNPVSAEHLSKEGLSETFITYMRRWKGFVAD
jgi:2,4-dienoyl-CoA reductase-like NADH-dependent reductase (Old Yellow Enzyme family)